MSTTYYERKAQGLCPVCGSERTNQDYILCVQCRVRNQGPQRSLDLENDRRKGDKLFLGLHEWMIRQGKQYTPEYHI